MGRSHPKKLEIVVTGVQRRPREVVKDERVLVHLFVVALDGNVAKDPVVSW